VFFFDFLILTFEFRQLITFAQLLNSIMLSSDQIKQLVGEAGAELVQDNMVIGMGSGSTVFYFIEALAKKIQAGLTCKAVPTSSQTRELALERGIHITELNDVSSIDLAVDGADEIDPSLELIKGGGGFLLQEKMVAAASKQLVIIIDNSKLKPQLGDFPLPIEVVPYGWKQVQHKIHELYNVRSALRMKNDRPYLTDHGHYILDAYFKKIEDPAAINIALHLIAGVAETGLFVNMCQKAIIGHPDGSIEEIIRNKK
jgi:ribose 5-phosphate isomerase A